MLSSLVPSCSLLFQSKAFWNSDNIYIGTIHLASALHPYGRMYEKAFTFEVKWCGKSRLPIVIVAGMCVCVCVEQKYCIKNTYSLIPVFINGGSVPGCNLCVCVCVKRKMKNIANDNFYWNGEKSLHLQQCH